ncbi:hypothetical protein CABS01_11457 [Colletotrichum abscissum]|nr:uncharacterized protein CABS01_11457 [Colletotrichum abscissum]KAK1494441.1 hypothetical protein CABS01_11457 [Colletotrichum abscissum]
MSGSRHRVAGPNQTKKPNYTQYQILGNYTHMTSIMVNNLRSWSMFTRR